MALPPGTLIPNVRWPGVTAGVQSFQYAVSHGITPSTAILVTNPQPKPPAGFGKLVWQDGRFGMALTDCKLARMTSRFGAGGFVYTLEILDRRWQWANGTFKNGGGLYNQLDPHGKLIPRTVRSPVELALICLQAMGERRFRIEGLPNGLSRSQARRATAYLQTGENYPITATNPPTNWEGLTPAGALAELCDRYGCRVVFQPGGDRLLIAKLGVGKPLTSGGSLAQASASFDAPETPVAVGVYGAPSQHQVRLALEPVTQEWDGPNHFVPIHEASYAPQKDGDSQAQITTCTVYPSGDATTATFSVHFPFGGVLGGVGLTSLFNNIQSSQTFREKGITVAQPSANVLTFTGTPKVPFSVQCRMTGGSTDRSRFDARITQPAKTNLIADWSRAAPPVFNGIRTTDRLALIEARNLANQFVWRAYRIMDEDAEFAHANARLRRQGKSAPFKPIIVPGYGRIFDRRQLTISGNGVEQVVPSPRDPNGIGRAAGNFNLAGGVLPEYYNGYARNRQARVFGQYARHIGSVFWNTVAGINTDPLARVKVEFSVDPFNQIILFNEPVYRQLDQGGGGVWADPELILECAVTVRDPETWSEVRPTYVRTIPGGIAPAEWLIKDDVVANYIGEYDDRNRLKKVMRPPEDADGPRRAQIYVLGMAAKYQTKAAQIQTWNGVVKIDPDGLVQQVSWQIGPQGIYTTAGTNSEFVSYLPQYPARRQRENLAADPNAALANAREGVLFGKLSAVKKGAGAVAAALAMR